MDAVTALYGYGPSAEDLKRYLASLEKKAAKGDQDALAQLAFIKTDWLKEDPAATLATLQKHGRNAKPVLLARMGQLAPFPPIPFPKTIRAGRNGGFGRSNTFPGCGTGLCHGHAYPRGHAGRNRCGKTRDF